MQFDVFRSEVCHILKNETDLPFMDMVLKEEWIRHYWDQKKYPEALYLTAMIDYLSKEHKLPIPSQCQEFRSFKLTEPLFPLDILLMDKLLPEKNIKEKEIGLCKQESLAREFLKYNIVERDIRDVE